MNRMVKATVYGLLFWLILMVTLHSSIYSLNFDWWQAQMIIIVLKPVILAVITVFMGNLYLKSSINPVYDGFLTGMLWLVINITLDLLLYLPESFVKSWVSFFDNIPLFPYLRDIGLVYVMIPIILLGIGYAKKNNVNEEQCPK